MIRSDQGAQFTSREWQVFLGPHSLQTSMRRRCNCHNNAIAESFFLLLKRERIRCRTDLTREAARQDVFEYIEMLCNTKRKHTNNRMLSPADCETTRQKRKRWASRKLGAPQTRLAVPSAWCLIKRLDRSTEST